MSSYDAHIIFVSHEWVGWYHPDPHGIQLKTFLRVMARFKSGEFDHVEMSSVHRLMYKENYITRRDELMDLVSAAYVWIDWSSMPQPSACKTTSKERLEKVGMDLQKAVKTIPAYVERSDFVAIVAPGCLHSDRRDAKTKYRATTCYRTYRSRGWCVLEVFASFLSRDKVHPSLLITSKEGTPEWMSPIAMSRLAVGLCDFTCCQRNHIFDDKVVPCDRVITREILETLIESKIHHLFKVKNIKHARVLLLSLFYVFRSTTYTHTHTHTPDIHMFRTMDLRSETRVRVQNVNSNMISLKKELRWEQNEGMIDQFEVSILMYACIKNELQVVLDILKQCRNDKRILNLESQEGISNLGITRGMTFSLSLSLFFFFFFFSHPNIYIKPFNILSFFLFLSQTYIHIYSLKKVHLRYGCPWHVHAAILS